MRIIKPLLHEFFRDSLSGVDKHVLRENDLSHYLPDLSLIGLFPCALVLLPHFLLSSYGMNGEARLENELTQMRVIQSLVWGDFSL